MLKVLYNLLLGKMQELKLLYALCTIFFLIKIPKPFLLIDAENASNSINRKVMLHNMRFLRSLISTYTCNCYASPARVFFFGGGKILSKEGTTQGDPTSKGLMPLVFYQVFYMFICSTFHCIFTNKLELLQLHFRSIYNSIENIFGKK